MNHTTKKILALLPADNRRAAETFFAEIAENFNYLFHIDYENDASLSLDVLEKYDGLFTFSKTEFPLPSLRFTAESKKDQQAFYVDKTSFASSKRLLALTQYLMKFYQQLQPDFLSDLPYRVRFFDAADRLIYSNHRPDSSLAFAEDSTDSQKLEETIIQELRQNEKDSLHFPIADTTFDHILIQSYQKLYDANQQLIGTLESVQDFKPILAAYLKETGQALVGWSDTTSGPSIADHSFSEE